MITDDDIVNIVKAFNSMPYKEREEVTRKAVAAGLYVIKKTAHSDETGSFVSKSYTKNLHIDDELWYHTYVTCMTDVLIKRYLP